MTDVARSGVYQTETIADNQRGAYFASDISLNDWLRVGQKWRDIQEVSRWVIADWILFGKSQFGESYCQAEAVFHYSYNTLARYARVAAEWPPETRHFNLPFSAYEDAIHKDLSYDDRMQLLAMAERGQWTVEQVRAAKREMLAANGGLVELPQRVTLYAMVSDTGALIGVDELFAWRGKRVKITIEEID